MLEKTRNDVSVNKNSDEKSYRHYGKDFERWHLNYTEINPAFDFQLNYVKYLRTWSALSNHIHENSSEIVYVLHGKQSYTVDGKDYNIIGGQILISPPGLVHSAQKGEAEQKGDFFYLTINPDCLPSVLPHDDETLSALNSILRSGVSVRVFSNVAQLSAAASELKRAYSDTRSCKNVRISCALMRLLLMTLDSSYYDTDLAPYSEFMERIYLFIEDHITENLSVSDVAAEVHYSQTGLQRKFRTYSNLSIHEYILNRKIEFAKKLMLEPDVNPFRIWEKLSFSSQTYFSQVFRKYTGLTISQYADRIKSKNNSKK